MGRGILRGAGGDENLKFNFIWPYLNLSNMLIRRNNDNTTSDFLNLHAIDMLFHLNAGLFFTLHIKKGCVLLPDVTLYIVD